MRKIVAGFAASADGYIEGLNGEYDWILIDPEIDFAAHLRRFDTLLFGRVSYEKVAAMGAGGTMPGIRNYVFSRTLTEVPPPYELVRGNLTEEVENLRLQPGKDIAVWGGAALLASLLDAGLVDELMISYIPVLLGSGKPMVDVLKEKVWLSLLNTRTYKNGTIAITYEVKRNKS